jgi:hypothetical protein
MMRWGARAGYWPDHLLVAAVKRHHNAAYHTRKPLHRAAAAHKLLFLVFFQRGVFDCVEQRLPYGAIGA